MLPLYDVDKNHMGMLSKFNVRLVWTFCQLRAFGLGYVLRTIVISLRLVIFTFGYILFPLHKSSIFYTYRQTWLLSGKLGSRFYELTSLVTRQTVDKDHRDQLEDTTILFQMLATGGQQAK